MVAQYEYNDFEIWSRHPNINALYDNHTELNQITPIFLNKNNTDRDP